MSDPTCIGSTGSTGIVTGVGDGTNVGVTIVTVGFSKDSASNSTLGTGLTQLKHRKSIHITKI